MNQHEITERRPLLDASGNLTEPGYAKTLLPIYRRSDIKAGKMRIKEWDYYCINNGHFALALTIADNSYMGLDSISLLNLDEGWEITKSPMRAFTNGRIGLPESSETGDVHSAGRNYSILFKNEGDKRVLIAQMKNFGPEGSLYAKVTLTDIPPESMVIATPFDKDKHFYFNQKINCMRAEGTVTYGYYNRTYTFDPADSFAVLDWGRGVWTYKNTWYWGSASGLVDGERFGFNIGYGFGNTSAASENMLFYKGRAHKLSQVTFHIPGDGGRRTPDYMQPWTFTSDDGRFEMDYTPVLDRACCSDVGLIKSDQHQVFGVFNGRAVLDDGTVLNVKDLPGFAEKVINKWFILYSRFSCSTVALSSTWSSSTAVASASVRVTSGATTPSPFRSSPVMLSSTDWVSGCSFAKRRTASTVYRALSRLMAPSTIRMTPMAITSVSMAPKGFAIRIMPSTTLSTGSSRKPFQLS